MTPTQRTLKWCRDQGYVADVAEHWNEHSQTRHDLFGFVDIVVLGTAITGVQCTTTANQAARIWKIKNHCRPYAEWWLNAGGVIWVIGWKKYKVAEDGKFWRPTVTEVTL